MTRRAATARRFVVRIPFTHPSHRSRIGASRWERGCGNCASSEHPAQPAHTVMTRIHRPPMWTMGRATASNAVTGSEFLPGARIRLFGIDAWRGLPHRGEHRFGGAADVRNLLAVAPIAVDVLVLACELEETDLA